MQPSYCHILASHKVVRGILLCMRFISIENLYFDSFRVVRSVERGVRSPGVSKSLSISVHGFQGAMRLITQAIYKVMSGILSLIQSP